MKPEKEEDPVPVSGDVIGDTAYSERFVLKILLKLANLDTLKDEIKEKSFEDDLCVLWDMTAERDVVTFLQKHDVLKLFYFTLPVIETPRIIEIIVGIIANMCCRKEVVNVLLNMDNLLNILVNYISSDDSLVLIQVLRLISACLFLANDDEITICINTFTSVDYSTALYFILKNSSHKELLVTALENLNTVCSYCNTEKFRMKFFTHFVTQDALESLIAAFKEIAIHQKTLFVKEEFERMYVITLQIILNLVGFDQSPTLYTNCTDDVLNMINTILCYYENKLVSNKEMDTDLIDVVESTTTIINILETSETCALSKYVEPTYTMWKTINAIAKSDENKSSFEDNDKEELEEFSETIKPHLSTLICSYISKCSNENLLKVLDTLGSDYEDIVNFVKDKELQKTVFDKTNSYRTRLKEANDS